MAPPWRKAPPRGSGPETLRPSTRGRTVCRTDDPDGRSREGPVERTEGEPSMTLHRARRAWLAAGAVVLASGLASPAIAGHVSPAQAQAPQDTLTELGVSGSSQTFLLVRGLLYCYTGTLGALVQDKDHVQYILSNNHVLAKENGNLNYGSANETIIQPGLLDEG